LDDKKNPETLPEEDRFIFEVRTIKPGYMEAVHAYTYTK